MTNKKSKTSSKNINSKKQSKTIEKSKAVKCVVTYYSPATGVIGFKDMNTGKAYQTVIKDYDNSGFVMFTPNE